MNIMKLRPFFLVFSLTLICISLFSIFKWGFKSSIDFSGGSVWEISTPNISSKNDIEQVFKDKKIVFYSVSEIHKSDYVIKFEPISNDKKVELAQIFKSKDTAFSELHFESLGPVLGKELLTKTITAIVLATLALFWYIGSRFSDRSFGLSAIIAMFHDAIILCGAFSLFGHFFGAEVDALFVTALLTTISASVHDTVVTYDRIRELRRQTAKIEWVHLVNQAVSETLVRSINNSMTVIFMLLALVLLGGETTRWFSTALLVGAVCGVYSSIGVATPLVLFWKERPIKKAKK